MMKSKALVTGGSADMAPAMAVLAINLKQVSPNLVDELIIYHDGIDLKTQSKINSIFPCRFIFYPNPFENVEDFPELVRDYFSFNVFCKYECFKLLDEFEKVVWTDFDVCFLKDISSVFDFDSPCYFLSGSKLRSKFCDDFDTSLFPDINFSKSSISTGLFGVSRTLTESEVFYRDCYSYTKKFAKYLKLPEEAVISVLLHKYGIVPEIVDSEVYAQPVSIGASEKTIILHAVGQPKFWNRTRKDIAQKNEIWEKNYHEWIFSFHGNRFECRYILPKIKVSIKRFLKKSLYKIVSFCLSDSMYNRLKTIIKK